METPSQIQLDCGQVVKDWLTSINLSQYIPMFMDNGFDNLFVCAHLEEKDLCDMGVSLLGHRKTILLQSKVLRTKLEEEKKTSAKSHSRNSSGDLEEAKKLAEKEMMSILQEFNERAHPRKPKEPSAKEGYKPNFRILLVRHGLSLANIDKNLYKTMADHVIPLSDHGKDQAREAGVKIKDFYSKLFDCDKPPTNFHCRLWTSPYRRARETAEHLMQGAGEWISSKRESIYLGEQQFGLFEGTDWTSGELDDLHPKEVEYYRKAGRFGGRFWAKVPLGESRFDVCMRVCRAFGSFHRDALRHGITDLVVVSHGITLRAFLMMWMHYNPEWFEMESNPMNCSIRLLENGDDKGYIHKGPEKPKDLLLSKTEQEVPV